MEICCSFYRQICSLHVTEIMSIWRKTPNKSINQSLRHPMAHHRNWMNAMSEFSFYSVVKNTKYTIWLFFNLKYKLHVRSMLYTCTFKIRYPSRGHLEVCINLSPEGALIPLLSFYVTCMFPLSCDPLRTTRMPFVVGRGISDMFI